MIKYYLQINNKSIMLHRCKGTNCKNPEHLQICSLARERCKHYNNICYKCHYIRINNSEIVSKNYKECRPRYGIYARNRISLL